MIIKASELMAGLLTKDLAIQMAWIKALKPGKPNIIQTNRNIKHRIKKNILVGAKYIMDQDLNDYMQMKLAD